LNFSLVGVKWEKYASVAHFSNMLRTARVPEGSLAATNENGPAR
jgi:hypothetical protein